MKLFCIISYDTWTLKSSNKWLGTECHIAQSLTNQAITLEYIALLNDSLALKIIRKVKRYYYQLLQQKNYQKDADPLTLKHCTAQIAQKLTFIT